MLKVTGELADGTTIGCCVAVYATRAAGHAV